MCVKRLLKRLSTVTCIKPCNTDICAAVTATKNASLARVFAFYVSNLIGEPGHSPPALLSFDIGTLLTQFNERTGRLYDPPAKLKYSDTKLAQAVLPTRAVGNWPC